VNENERVTIEKGVAVGVAPGHNGATERTLRADVYRPPAILGDPPDAGWPALLLIHGGAWRIGDRSQLQGYGIFLARAGWLTVACEYRLTPEAPWPAHLHDVKTALRWMRARADELHIDPDRVVTSGNSAGGHLALMLAGTPGVAEVEGEGGHPGERTDVAACCAVYPPTIMDEAVALITDAPTPEVARQASPLTYVGPGFPPTLLVHGAKDEVVSAKHSREMYDALRRAGVPVDLHVFADQPHGFDATRPYGRRVIDELLFFLDRYVLDRYPPARPMTPAATI
jgi:acetyl esterase/lipase